MEIMDNIVSWLLIIALSTTVLLSLTERWRSTRLIWRRNLELFHKHYEKIQKVKVKMSEEEWLRYRKENDPYVLLSFILELENELPN